MGFRTWADSKVKTMSWVDLKLAQLSAVAVLVAEKPAYNALRK